MQLLLGFSYSLMPDGSSGPHNHRLAGLLQQALPHPQTRGEIRASVQWAIADALSFLAPDFLRPLLMHGSCG